MVDVENVAFNNVDKLLKYDRQEHRFTGMHYYNFWNFQPTDPIISIFLAVNILA
jgi:hypothetical protein